MDNALAREHCIPKWLRRYHQRYGKGGVARMLQEHVKNRAHTSADLAAVGLPIPEREVSVEVSCAA